MFAYNINRLNISCKQLSTPFKYITKIFYRNVRFEIKITVSHCEVFLFILRKYSKDPMKNNKRRKETHHNPQGLMPDISILQLRLVFQLFDVHLSLMMMRSEHKAKGANQGESLD